MLKLVLVVLVEAAIGVAVAGVVLAVGIPLMIHRNWIAPGDLAGSMLVLSVLALSVSGMLLRPGSAISRRCKGGD